MAYTTINKHTDYFNTLTYTGDGTSPKTITGVGFQPDWIWGKRRDDSAGHNLYDAVRGAGNNKNIQSNGNGVEGTGLPATFGYISAFATDGFTTTEGSTDNAYWNKNTATYVTWNWKAGGGQGSSNTDGTINTTYTSVNTTAGFSISKYTGTGSAGATVGHGLGVAPKMIIVKGLTYADVWIVGGDNLGGWNKEMYLNANDAVNTNNNAFNGVAPTSSVFTLGSGNATNKSGETYVAYCFVEKQGYSKFGSYAGNGSTDGNFLYTGFKPSFFIHKRSDTTGNWGLFDNKRSTTDGNNVINKWVNPDLSNAEGSSSSAMNIDFVSNGVKIREDNGDLNTNGGDYIYIAFGQSIVGSNNIPATAR